MHGVFAFHLLDGCFLICRQRLISGVDEAVGDGMEWAAGLAITRWMGVSQCVVMVDRGL